MTENRAPAPDTSSSQKGWVALHRQILESQVWKNPCLLQVWLWCLLKARHKPGWVTINVGRSETEIWLEKGQFVYGRKSASRQLRMKPSSIRNRMQKLRNMRNLDIESNTHYSIVTIINWDAYQSQKKNEDTEKDSRRTPGGHPEDTNNNDNHVFNNGDNEQQQAGCGCGDPLSFKKQNSNANQPDPPGLTAEQFEYIELRVEHAAVNGEIKKSRQAYRSRLVSLAKAGNLDISDIDILRRQQSEKPQTAPNEITYPGNVMAWTMANKDPWELLGIDRSTFNAELQAGKILYNPTDSTYGRSIYDDEYKSYFFEIANPDGGVSGSDQFHVDGKAYKAESQKYADLEMSQKYKDTSPREKKNLKVLHSFINDPNAGKEAPF